MSFRCWGNLCLVIAKATRLVMRAAVAASRVTCAWDDCSQYLVESIRKFPRQQDFARLIHEAGFQSVSFENMSGGIVAIHSGFKPLAHEAHA